MKRYKKKFLSENGIKELLDFEKFLKNKRIKFTREDNSKNINYILYNISSNLFDNVEEFFYTQVPDGEILGKEILFYRK